MKNLLFLRCTVLSIGLQGQSLDKTDFEKTEWFSDKELNIFLKSDTISLIKVVQLNNESIKANTLFSKYLKDGNGMKYLPFLILTILKN